jgi:ABC-type protease/lipase transport system fused ATPase/permease subunit
LKNNLPDKSINLPPLQGHIKVDNLSYKPSQNSKTMLLKNISFSLEPGDCLAIIGPSGSGKSTLLKFLAGILSPTEGSVRIDNAEISQQLGQIGQYIGFMGQHEDFFPASVKLNIGRMDPNADEQEIIRAAQLAGVHDMILSLPDGYETPIGMGGHTLSSGQKQKVALARCLYKVPKVLLLDEPNSHLDAMGEAHLTRLIEAMKKHKVTSVIISHRSSILKVANKCAVIRGGEMIAFGPTQDIIKSQAANNAPENSVPQVIPVNNHNQS